MFVEAGDALMQVQDLGKLFLGFMHLQKRRQVSAAFGVGSRVVEVGICRAIQMIKIWSIIMRGYI